MSKSPLLEENVVRRWAKYAGIQGESKDIISEMYTRPNLEEHGDKDTGASEDDESKTHPGEKDYTTKKDDELKDTEDHGARGEKKGDKADVNEGDGAGSIEEGDLLAELESLLGRRRGNRSRRRSRRRRRRIDGRRRSRPTLMLPEGEDVDVEVTETGLEPQQVEDALKAGLEAMAAAIGDALGIKIDVRAGEAV